MKKAILLIILIFVCFTFSAASAADWKLLHERADGLTLEKVLALPPNPEGLYLLGLAYLNLHRDKDAKDIFLKLIIHDRDNTGARWGLAEVLRRQHKLDEAENLCRELINKHPDFAPAYITLAYIKYLRLEFIECIRLAIKVIRMGREKSDLTNLARAYSLLAGANGTIAHYSGPISKLINGTQVMSNLKRAQALRPDSAAVLFGFGSFYLLAPSIAGGDINKALVYLDKAKEKDPLMPDIYVRLSQAYRLKGDKKKADEYLSKALEIDPGNELAADAKSGDCKYVCSP